MGLLVASAAALVGSLAEAKDRGLLGPCPVEGHVEHALGFALAWAACEGNDPPAGLCIDLGPGAGLPGLALALLWPRTSWLLVDSRARSIAMLEESVERLGLRGRVVVVGERAELLGRRDPQRSRAALVVARGFGAPPATAECAAPLLGVGGLLVVSEPPESDGSRWSGVEGTDLGLARRGVWAFPQGSYAVLAQLASCSAGYPRRVGMPRKRPLW